MKQRIVPYAIAAAVGLVIAVAIMLGKNIFAETDAVKVMQILSDSFFVPGVLLTGVGLLVFVSNAGLFDMLAYGVHLIYDRFIRDVTKRKYRTFYDYKESRKDKKKDITSLLMVGIVFIILSVVFLILHYQLS